MGHGIKVEKEKMDSRPRSGRGQALRGNDSDKRPPPCLRQEGATLCKNGNRIIDPLTDVRGWEKKIKDQKLNSKNEVSPAAIRIFNRFLHFAFGFGRNDRRGMECNMGTNT